MIKTFPLESISLEEAKQKQFKLIDTITKHFRGDEILTRGDLGLVKNINKPKTTLKVEETLADFFGAERAVLVRGSGTAAIKMGMYSILKEVQDRIVLIHKAPIYPTTKVIFGLMGVKTIEADFNNTEELERILISHKNINMALIQYTRQKIDDSYNIEKVIKIIKEKNIPILTDDNYAVMKVSKIGAELGGDLSAFSTFKLLGPEGIGCVLGKKQFVDKIIEANYSGGSQVQGHEALDVLQGLVYAPVSLAIQAEVGEEIFERLNKKELKFVKNVFLANAQSKVIIVEFTEDIAEKIVEKANEFGSLPNPVGAESKYEYVPLFYRVSGTFRDFDPTMEKRMIRINPNRSGANTIIRILEESYKKVKEEI